MPEDVGVNAVVPSLWAKRAGLSIIDVARYPSTPYEIRSRVAILPVNKKAPLTKTIHLVSGSYKNGSQGVLSVFPGQFTPPFPKKDETNLVLKEFWTDHLFLADAEQVYLAIKEELTHKHPESFEGEIEKIHPGLKNKAKDVFVRRHIEGRIPFVLGKGRDLAKLNLNVQRDHLDFF